MQLFESELIYTRRTWYRLRVTGIDHVALLNSTCCYGLTERWLNTIHTTMVFFDVT